MYDSDSRCAQHDTEIFFFHGRASDPRAPAAYNTMLTTAVNDEFPFAFVAYTR